MRTEDDDAIAVPCCKMAAEGDALGTEGDDAIVFTEETEDGIMMGALLIEVFPAVGAQCSVAEAIADAARRVLRIKAEACAGSRWFFFIEFTLLIGVRCIISPNEKKIHQFHTLICLYPTSDDVDYGLK